MGPDWLAGVLSLARLAATGLAVGVLLTVVPLWLVRLPERVAARRAVRLRRPVLRPLTPRPEGAATSRRPIEEIVVDLRRLQARYHHPAPGVRFAKHEGIRRAYDSTLGEACAALGHPHLLDVLPPGQELDRERLRVEAVLWSDGLRFDEAA